MRKHKLNRLALLFVLAMTSHALWAQIPSGYYDNAVGKTGNQLKVALHNIIDDHRSISYGQILNAFWSTDNKGNGVVWDMYSDIPNGTPAYTFQLGQDNCESDGCNSEGGCYNREHSWPQSWFNRESTPSTDLHHVFATDCYVNKLRSNYPFGKVGTATWTFTNGSKLGSCVTSGYSGIVFEPIDEYKGDFARALMYMSVRYYGEDANWHTSGMTNKSEILPWAIAMLMEWNEQDPVSQKEIDRNNVIYNNYQHNRNPFIDHPEYARAIWDPNWTGVEYNISYATVQNGSITGPVTATQGSTVRLTATPTVGYMLGSWTVYKTGDQGTTVSVNADGTFTMPSYNVTVGATFVVNNTYYTITRTSVQHGSIGTNVDSAKSGTTVGLTATPATGYALYSWYVYKTGDMNTMVYTGQGSSFTMPAFDVTVRATFAPTSGGGDYEKVTTALSDWSGDYLIVYEAGNKAFNGALTNLDVASNTISVTITNNKIASNSTTDASKFTVAKTGTNYTIKSASGYYIGRTSNSNGMNTSTSQQYTNTISLNNGVAVITGSAGLTLQYNSTSGQTRFRYFGSNQQPIQLFKKATGIASVPTHTIQFNSNGGSGSMANQTVNEYEPTSLTANAFQYTGYEFMGWNTQADGLGQYYADGAVVSLLDDLTLYAQWEQLYDITVDNNIVNGAVSVSQNQAVEGSLIRLTATPATGYELDLWTVADALGTPISVVDDEFEMPASNVTVSASFVYVGQFDQKYYLVTNVSQLEAGRTYLIVNTSAGMAMGAPSSNSNNRTAVGVSVSNHVIAQINSNVRPMVLGGQTGAWTFFDASWETNGGYLYASSSSSNHLKTKADVSNDANGHWSIAIASDGTATIIAQGSNTRNHLRYNPNGGSPMFSCYANTSTMAKVELYVLSKEFVYDANTTLACLNTFDKHTIQSGVTLTASQVLGLNMCNEASNLVLEDGAQLVHGVAGLNATVKKTIAAYSGDGGWYTLATPFTAFAPSGAMVGSDYDLYAYDEDGDSQGMEWINYKPNGSFSLASGMGYLYAHSPATTLRMMGTLNSGSYSQQVSLGFANSDATLKGLNLLGNPTAHEITFSKTSNVSNGYYYLDNGSTWTYTTSTTVSAGRGFLVKANAGSQSVTLNPQSRGVSDEQGQYLCIAIGEEKAYVKLDEGVSMPLLSLRGQHSSLYLLSERQPYVMLVRDGADALDLCYEPRHNGKQTLSFDLQGLNLDYLHLIDNLTGDDVDLLTTPSYTFNARTTDYASRFHLVFNANNVNEQNAETFAFFNGSEWVVGNQGEATLQVIDVMGRVLSNETITGNATISLNQVPGVYMLRLVTADGVRVQKVVLD